VGQRNDSGNVAGKRAGVRNPAALVRSWPVLRQLLGDDRLGLGRAAQSARSASLRPRIAEAERKVASVCPYCAVGCGQEVYVKDGRITQIEGDPASPVSRGKLCPKGAATRTLVAGTLREYAVKYRRPHSRHWEDLPLDQAMDMIADRIIKAREETWEEHDDRGRLLRRSLGVANLGGATLDNEENYTIKKLMSALGFVQVENQARI
jgi:formate dehydrogenase major subunit